MNNFETADCDFKDGKSTPNVNELIEENKHLKVVLCCMYQTLIEMNYIKGYKDIRETINTIDRISKEVGENFEAIREFIASDLKRKLRDR